MTRLDIGSRVRGLDTALSRLQRYEAAPQRIEKALDEAAAIVERAAIENVPVDEGELASSVHVETPEPGRRLIGSDKKQAVFTEHSPRILKGGTPEAPRRGPWPYTRGGITRGTKATARVPWLRPALYANAQRIKALIRQAIGGKND